MIFVLALITSLIVAIYFDRKLVETLPGGVFFVMLVTYSMAILKHLSRSILIGSILLILISGFILFFIIKNKKNFSILCKPLSWGLLAYVLIISGSIIIFKNHIVTNWDDFNYWAMFSKNIELRNTFVYGAESCSVYKDYTPIIQLLYYLVFESFGGFNEGLMFVTNNCLIFTLMLPFFSWEKFEDTSIFRMIAGILIPIAFMYQQLHCLGVDCILAVLFGYLLVKIIIEKKRDLYFYIETAMGFACLILTKTSGLILFFAVIVTWFLFSFSEKKEKKDLLYIVLTSAPAIAFYISWNAFCALVGNTSYLSDKAVSSIAAGGFLHFPEYTATFLIKFVRAILGYNLNRGFIGMTPFTCMIIIAAVAFYDKKFAMVYKTLAIGFAVYLLFLIYTYLFVFVEWEAMSLSSFDRYISAYLIGVLYLAIYRFFDFKLSKGIYISFLIIILATLNYPMLYEHCSYNAYNQAYQDIIDRREAVAKRLNEFYSMVPDLYCSRVLIINETGDDELEKYQQYEFVPTVSFIMHKEGKQDIDERIISELKDHGLRYAIDYDTGVVYEYADGQLIEK